MATTSGAPCSPALVRAARAALDAHLLADGPVATDAALAGHRAWMRAVKAAVVVGLAGQAGAADEAAASRWLSRLEALQVADGLFAAGDNLASPPDSAFTVTDVAATAAALRRPPATASAWVAGAAGAALGARLEQILRRAVPALVVGGVHTPNHRWELSGALVGAAALLEGPAAAAAVDRAREWLTEGVDLDADGLYSERSANYAAYVSGPALLLLAERLGRPALSEAVHTNLHTVLDLTTPRGTTETVHSRRQDQHDARFPLGPFLTLFARFAPTCDRCRDAAAWALRLPGVDPVDAVLRCLTEGDVAAGLALADERGAATDAERAAGALGSGQRTWGAARLWRRWGGADWTLVYGGSDVPAAGRVASGLACNPTFLRLARGDVEVASVRLSRDFFGLGPFRATGLRAEGDRVVLSEELAASYYQPLPVDAHRPDGDYTLEFEGRFASAMAFSQRPRDELRLETRVVVEVRPDGVDLEVRTTGPATGHALEIAFADEVQLEGAEPVGPQLSRVAGGPVVVRAGGSALTVTALPGGDSSPAVYSPGEAYEFLGGTDAVGGRRLYVTWSSPGTQRVTLRAR
ncbi:hypothetical protein [Cellulomonas sp. SG140]|uniref:hypothetical protein n=1 Tax=Cellulomonas sp. SG140 TaxID=2976536 RepID=UPI0021E76541|nr:hypothetical protein [Cellulomonas sp. SG140]